MSYYTSEIHFIFELQLQAERYFPKASFYLKVKISGDDGSKDLHFIVKHCRETSGTEAYEQMEKFTDEWWVHNMDRAPDLFVTSEFSEAPKEEEEL